MIEEKYNNQTYPAEFFANIVNGARIDDTSVFKIENGALAQIWPNIITLSPVLRSSETGGSFFHSYVKTTNSEFLEIFIGEYSGTQGAGWQTVMLDFNFTDLNSNLPVIFDVSVDTNDSGVFSAELLVNDVVWKNYFPDSQTHTETFTTWLSSFVLSVRCKTNSIGRMPSHDGFLRVTFSKLKNGYSKKFSWPAPQTIYEVWP